MNDAQRYRMNAAECLSAAERSDPAYRGLTLAIAASWLSLARQQEAVDGLLAIWSKAQVRTANPTCGLFGASRNPRSDGELPEGWATGPGNFHVLWNIQSRKHGGSP
jgi:hypothetical protein